MSKRAQRRHHRERLRTNRKFYHDLYNPKFIKLYSEEELEHKRAKLTDTPCPCSCYMCGNPRRYEKKTTYKTRIEIFFEDER